MATTVREPDFTVRARGTNYTRTYVLDVEGGEATTSTGDKFAAVHVWYDVHTRQWIAYRVEADTEYQVGGAVYDYDREYVFDEAYRLAQSDPS